jgi:microsomal dipeptidase-like Zn-dependent dipeptidase
VNSLVEGATCFGGIVLNPPVGGLNPCAVETSIRFGGKVVWLPSFYSREHLRSFPQFKGAVPGPPGGITILKDGQLVEEMREILDLVAERDLILGTSHCSREEIAVLVEQAAKHKVKKIVVTHPYCPVPDLSLDEQAELVQKGAYLELCLYSAMPISGKVSVHDFARTINKVGADHVVLATDFGQPFHPTPAEGMRMFCTSLVAAGIAKEEIDIMTKRNPAHLLGL